jgi:putative transposase
MVALGQLEAKNTLPRRKRIRLPLPDYHRSGAWYFLTICCWQKRECFQTGSARKLVVEILQQTARENRMEIAAYTIMPTHVHLIGSAGSEGVVRFVRAFKGRVAARLRNQFGGQPIWQRSFFDHKIRSEESLNQKCQYIWLNPVRRGLARSPEEYAWSGFATNL